MLAHREAAEVNLSEDGRTLTGYLVKYDRHVLRYITGDKEFKEVFSRGAFENTVSKDCCIKSPSGVLARVRKGTLELTQDDKGLFFKAELAEPVRAGLDRLAFAFSIEAESYDSDTRTRTIEAAGELLYCSFNPGFDQIAPDAEAFFQAEVLKERRASEDALMRRQLIERYLLEV